MKKVVQAVPRELDRMELLELVGGDGSGFFQDLGYLVGYISGCVSNVIEFARTQPPASYAYGKVGYAS